MHATLEPAYRRSTGLVDVLDRVLDKGLVIAGDVRVSLAEVELLTIRIRLLICSVDKAEEIGMDWWRYDPALSPGVRRGQETEELRAQVRDLQARLEALGADSTPARAEAEGPRTRSPEEGAD